MDAAQTERLNVAILEKATWMPRAPEGMSQYIAGRCYEFALALATFLPSAEPVALLDGISLDHAGLRLPNGCMVDVRGISSGPEAFAAGFRLDLGLPQAVSWDALVDECGVEGILDPWQDVKAMAQAMADVQKRFPGLRPVPDQ